MPWKLPQIANLGVTDIQDAQGVKVCRERLEAGLAHVEILKARRQARKRLKITGPAQIQSRDRFGDGREDRYPGPAESQRLEIAQACQPAQICKVRGADVELSKTLRQPLKGRHRGPAQVQGSDGIL